MADHDDFFNAIRTIPADVTFRCSDGDVGVIKSIIMARSQVFKRMLDGTFNGTSNGTINNINETITNEKSSQNTIDFPDESSKVMQLIINYLQYDELPPENMEINDLFDLYIVSDKYNITEVSEFVHDELNIIDGKGHVIPVDFHTTPLFKAKKNNVDTNEAIASCGTIRLATARYKCHNWQIYRWYRKTCKPQKRHRAQYPLRLLFLARHPVEIPPSDFQHCFASENYGIAPQPL